VQQMQQLQEFQQQLQAQRRTPPLQESQYQQLQVQQMQQLQEFQQQLQAQRRTPPLQESQYQQLQVQQMQQLQEFQQQLQAQRATPPLQEPQYLRIFAGRCRSQSPIRRCESPLEPPGLEGTLEGNEIRSPEVKPLCPQPRRPFMPLFEGPSLPASPLPAPVPSGQELCELLGLSSEKKAPESGRLHCFGAPCESRPLSSLSTSAGPTPSPDEMASIFQMSFLHSYRTTPNSAHEMFPDFEGTTSPSGPPGLTWGTGDWPSSPATGCWGGAAPDDLPMMVHPSTQYVAPATSAAAGVAASEPREGLAVAAAADAADVPSPGPCKRERQRGGAGGQRSGGAGRAKVSEAAPRKVSEAVGKDDQRLTQAVVVQMSKTQAGSKLLQRKLLKGHPSVITDIIDGIEGDLPDIMRNMYGNYLCSAAFQACSVAQRLRMLEMTSKHLRAVATDKWGTHALQALISLVCTSEEQSLLMPPLQEHVIELSCDPNGAHVVQRALISFGSPCPDLLLQEVARCVTTVAHNPHGLCVLKKCITQSRCGVNQQRLLHEMSIHALELVQAPYGNYAVQHALEEWGGEICVPIIQALTGKFTQLSIQKFSSNVIEDMLRLSPPEVQLRIMEELTKPDQMQVLMSTVYGHYVAKRILQAVPPERRSQLERGLSASLKGPRSQRLRDKWESVLSGEQPDEAPFRELREESAREEAEHVATAATALPQSAARRRGPRARGRGAAASLRSGPHNGGGASRAPPGLALGDGAPGRRERVGR